MLNLMILEAVALAAMLWILAIVLRAPAGQIARRGRLVIPAALGAAVLLGAITRNFMVYTNNPGAVSSAGFADRTGLHARAAEWLTKHGNAPPARDEVGRNIRLITEGVAFLRPYHRQLAPHHVLQIDEATRLPTRLTRVLSPVEEGQYYEAARAVVEAVQSLAPPR